MSFIILKWFFILLIYASCTAIGSTNTFGCTIDSIYQFGDSISDTGNLNILAPNVASTKLPYGESYPGYPTGRWSNGRLIIDYATNFYGLQPLSHFLSQTPPSKSGINFAVAGATAIDTSILASNGINAPTLPGLSTQINWFKTFVDSYCPNKTDCRDKLKNSLIFFGEIGGNDINYGIISNKTQAELTALLPTIIEAIVQKVEVLIKLGATKFVVPGNFPIGCIAAGQSVFGGNLYDAWGCNAAANDLAINQNIQLISAIKALEIKYFPYVKINYLDYYSGFKNLFAPYSGFSKDNLFKACCGTGDYNVSSPRFCGGEGVPVCAEPDKYINWDGIHLTQEAYYGIFRFVEPIISSTLGCFT